MSSFARRRTALLSLALVLVATVAAAALAEVWSHEFPKAGSFGGVTVGMDGTTFWVGQQGAGHFLQRFDQDGDRDYNKRVRGGGKPWALATAPDGSGVVLAGETTPKGSFPVPWVALYRTDNGRPIWQTAIVEHELTSIAAVVVSADGQSIYATGTRVDFDAAPQDRDVFVAKLSVDGDVLWTTFWDDALDDQGMAIVVDPKKEQRVCVSGASGMIGTAPFYEALLLCFATDDGELDWEWVEGDPQGYDSINALAISPNGKKLYAGGYTDRGATVQTRDSFFQPFNARNGKPGPRRHFDVGDGPDETISMVRAPDGAFWLGADGCNDAFTQCDTYLLRLNRKGALQETLPYAIVGARNMTGGLGVAPDSEAVWGGESEAGMWIRRIRQ